MAPPDDDKTLDLAKLRQRAQYASDGGANVIHVAGQIVARAMSLRNGDLPAREWMFGLDGGSYGRVLGAIQSLNSLLDWGWDADLQLVPVASKCGLRALVVHDSVRKAHLTVLGHVDGNTFWIATGYRTRPDGLTHEQIAEADNIAAEWMAG